MEISLAPLISVIIPVYNAEKHLERCLNSVINQIYKRLEIILVNDGSTDMSGKICEDYAKRDDRIYVITKENGGASSARNNGLEICHGEYVSFVDSDDWISLDMYSFLIDKAIRYDADIVSGSFILTRGETTFKQKDISIRTYEGDEKLMMYLDSGMKSRLSEYSPCNKIYRKRLFSDIRFPVGQIYEDVVTNLKLIDIANRFVQSNKILYFYYQGEVSTIRGKFSHKDLDLLLVGKQTVDYVQPKNNDKLLLIACQKQARAYFTLLLKAAVFGIDDEFAYSEDVILELKSKLRTKYWYLLRSTMPINRKAIMTILCIDYRIIRAIAAMYFKLRIN